MPQLPYYSAQARNPLTGVERQQSIGADPKYAEINKTLSTAEKFFDNLATSEASKQLAKAQSDLTMRINDLQNQVGDDAEGFTDTVKGLINDYKNELINSVPLSKRNEVSDKFTQIGLNALTKANLFENTALSNKIKSNMEETINLNANLVLSDPTQMDSIMAQTESLIDGQNVNSSVKKALIKQSNNQIALAAINGGTMRNPYAIQKELNSGKFDSILTPQQKATALRQVKAQIKHNENEVATLANKKEKLAMKDLVDNFGTMLPTQVEEFVKENIHKKENVTAIHNMYQKYLESADNINQTYRELAEGTFHVTGQGNRNRLNKAYDNFIANSDLGGDLVSSIQKQTEIIIDNGFADSGELPLSYTKSLAYAMNSNDMNAIQNAGVNYVNMKETHPNIKDKLSKDMQSDLLIAGYASNAGYNGEKIKELLNNKPLDEEVKKRNSDVNKEIKNGKLFNYLPFGETDSTIKSVYSETYRNFYKRTGDSDLSAKVAVANIKDNYSVESVGTGGKDVIAKNGIMKEYGNSWGSGILSFDFIKRRQMEEQLKENVLAIYPEAEGMDIGIEQNGYYDKGTDSYKYLITLNGSPMYKDGRLQFFAPSWVEYVKSHKKSDDFIGYETRGVKNILVEDI